MWIEFQKPEEADATEMILEPDSGEDQPVTSQSGVLTVRSDGAPGGLSSFLPSFPPSLFTSFPFTLPLFLMGRFDPQTSGGGLSRLCARCWDSETRDSPPSLQELTL